MSHTYNGNPANNPSVITLPDDGDDEVVLSVNAPFQDLADNVAHIGEPTFTNAVGYPLLTRTVNRVMAAMPWQDDGTGGNSWTYGAGGGGSWIQTITSAGAIVQPVDGPHDGQLDELRVYIQGSPTDVGLPATKPQIRLYEVDPFLGTETILSTVNDSPANLAAYQAIHPIIMPLTFGNLNKISKRYVLELFGEAGAGSNSGMQYWGTIATFTVVRTDPLAG